MSCFAGKTREFPDISLDRFDSDNLNSVVYFLSHCHSDHMIGLEAPEFAARLSTYPSIKLYCQTVTAGLLLAMPPYAHLRPYVQSMPIDDEHLISVESVDGKNKYHVTVTLIPAGHCPGSTMILIQQDSNCTVLYTGDFRVHVGDTVKLRSLFTDGVLRSKIRSVYADTTFCVPEALYIPSRENCKTIVIDTISNWLGRENSNSRQIVHIFSRSFYGYEYLMMALAQHFKCKVHVSSVQYQRYRFVPDITNHLTNDASSTQIHFCQSNKLRGKFDKTLPCGNELNFSPNLLQIIPSVMYFTKSTVTPKEMVMCESERVVRVCYSSHSSYEEIVDFLAAIKPEFIYANVRPNSNLTLEDVRRSLSFLECSSDSETSAEPEWADSTVIFRKPKKLCYMEMESSGMLQAEVTSAKKPKNSTASTSASATTQVTTCTADDYSSDSEIATSAKKQKISTSTTRGFVMPDPLTLLRELEESDD